MAKQLGVKPEIINSHPLLEHRLLAADNGWPLIPARRKRGGPNWPRVKNARQNILKDKVWRDPYYDGTGIRLEGDICTYDSDVSEEAVADEILEDLFQLDMDAYDGAIRRTSGTSKIAIFWRCRVPFRHLKTRSYTAHPEYLDELALVEQWPEATPEEDKAKHDRIRELRKLLDPQKVEFYSAGGGPHHFQFEGMHSEGEAGKPDRYYRCDKWPWEIRREDVALMPQAYDIKDHHGQLLDRAEAILAKHLTLIPESAASAGGDTVYDLTPDMYFYPAKGDRDTIENLVGDLDASGENGIAGCAEWTKATSASLTDCKLFVTTSGRVAIKDWSADGRLHLMAADAPPPPVELDEHTRAVLRALAGDTAAAVPSRSEPLDDIDRGDTPEEAHSNALNWLARNIAFYPQAFAGRGGAVSIQPDGEFPTPVTIAALRGALGSYSYVEEGPRGGKRICNPVGAWTMLPEQVRVYGIRMRPELPQPLFVENDLRLINRYAPAVHPAGGGSIAVFERRLTALVPDAVERVWVWNWLACLVQHPEWRMVALVMIAREHGSGRGLLAETMQLVLGEQFVVSLPYDSVTGGSRFNAEVEGRLLVYVNEAHNPEANRHSFKTASREALKVFIEPNHRIPQRIEPKGVNAYYTRLAISTLILANSIKAVPADEADRRTAVVMNGAQMTVEERDEFQGWMADRENIGALWRHLKGFAIEQDRALFDPYMAPMFVGRDRMIDANRSIIDRAWAAAIEKLRAAADLYCMSQVVAVAQHVSRSQHGDFADLIRSHTYEHGFRIGVKRPVEVNWRIRYGDEQDNRQAVFAFDDVAAKHWTHAGPHAVKQELDKAQKVVAEPHKAFNKLLQLVKTDAEEE